MCVLGPGPQRPATTHLMTYGMWGEGLCTCRTWWIEESLRSRLESIRRSEYMHNRCHTHVTWTMCKQNCVCVCVYEWSPQKNCPCSGVLSVTVKYEKLYKHWWSVFSYLNDSLVLRVGWQIMQRGKGYFQSILQHNQRLWFMAEVNVKLILALIGFLSLHRLEKSISGGLCAFVYLWWHGHQSHCRAALCCFNVFIDSCEKLCVL